jgi:hypothetical protein
MQGTVPTVHMGGRQRGEFTIDLILHFLQAGNMSSIFTVLLRSNGERGSIVVRSATLQAGKSRVRITIRPMDFFFNLPNPSSRTMALGLTQPLTEITIPGIFLGSKERLACKADNLAAICEPIV